MRRLMVIGPVGCGKTTFCQRILGRDLVYQKTQSVQLVGSAIDTPGEYMESRAYYRALLVSAVEADVILLMQQAGDRASRYAPGIASMFQKPVLGVVTKIDCCEEELDIRRAEDILLLAGATPVFSISSVQDTGIEVLMDYIQGLDLRSGGSGS